MSYTEWLFERLALQYNSHEPYEDRDGELRILSVELYYLLLAHIESEGYGL